MSPENLFFTVWSVAFGALGVWLGLNAETEFFRFFAGFTVAIHSVALVIRIGWAIQEGRDR